MQLLATIARRCILISWSASVSCCGAGTELHRYKAPYFQLNSSGCKLAASCRTKSVLQLRDSMGLHRAERPLQVQNCLALISLGIRARPQLNNFLSLSKLRHTCMCAVA
jgi:hypothetical protein